MEEPSDSFSYSDDENSIVERYEELRKNGKIGYFDVDDFEEIISHYLETGKPDRAGNVVEIARLQHPSSSSLVVKEAELCSAIKQPEKAIRCLNRLIFGKSELT